MEESYIEGRLSFPLDKLHLDESNFTNAIKPSVTHG